MAMAHLLFLKKHIMIKMAIIRIKDKNISKVMFVVYSLNAQAIIKVSFKFLYKFYMKWSF